MVIYLKAGGNLRLSLKPDIDYYTRRVVTEKGKTVKEILADIGINPACVAFVYTEGKGKGLHYIPSDGQTITLQPPVSGG
ncbi:MAG: MoaD/ThiS family protein [Candidatus Aminicenantes bacterium]|nr:MoaD/ThiS family protein [Candidatus Aminicenantes bacterium]